MRLSALTAVGLAVMTLGAAEVSLAVAITGDVFPDPTGGTVSGPLTVGNVASGSLDVVPGDALTAGGLRVGAQPTGSGTVHITGPATTVNLTGPTSAAQILNPLELGAWGSGTMTIDSGAQVNAVLNNPNCISTNCNVFVGNAAGSTGNLTITGNGSQLNVGPTGFVVGSAAVFTQQSSGFDFGTPGGTTNATVVVQSGAALNTQRGAISFGPGGAAPTGTERTFGTVIVDGLGSAWNIVRNAAVSGAQQLLGMATGANSTATLEVKNGGKVVVDGSAGSGQFSGINMATGGPTSSATLRVDGAGSRLEVAGGTGFFNIGNSFTAGPGGTAAVHVTNGGAITGVGPSGLVSAVVGNNRSAGSLTVAGTDASGNPSLFRLADKSTPQSGTPFSAFLHIAANGGSGSAAVSGGGRIEIDARGAGATQFFPGINVGAGPNTIGSLSISGTSAVTGAPSTVVVFGDSVNPIARVGAAGANGTLNVSGGGRFELNGTGASTLADQNTTDLFIGATAATGYPNAPGTGVVSVTGTGSTVALTGTGDNQVVVGVGGGSTGTLNVSNGGSVSALQLIVGNIAGSGALNANGGSVALSGQYGGGPNAGNGPLLMIGREGGTGAVSLANGSNVSVASSAPLAGVLVGGTNIGPSGSGTLSVTGGSTLSVAGPSARIVIGTQGTPGNAGVGTMTIAGPGSSVSASGSDSRVVIGANANTIGTVTVGAGAMLNAGTLLGVGHNGSVGSGTGGTATLINNGAVTASNVFVGSGGFVGGVGTVTGNMINFGTVAPGISPGTLNIQGDYVQNAGVLEIEIGGLGLGQYDVLNVTGNAIFTGGQILFSFIDGFLPEASDSVEFLTAIAVSGLEHVTFAYEGAASGFEFSISAPDGGLTFTALNDAQSSVPEPGTLALLCFGLAGIVFARRSKLKLLLP